MCTFDLRMHSQRDVGCSTSGTMCQKNLPTTLFQHVVVFPVLANRQPLEIHAEYTNPQTQRNRGSLPELSDSTSDPQGKTTV